VALNRHDLGRDPLLLFPFGPVAFGETDVSDTQRTLAGKLLQGIREYLLITLYLWVVFALFALYKSVILAENGIAFTPQGFALINALAMAKVILTAQKLRLADQFKDAPLIYPTLVKSAAFTVVLTSFKIVEAFAVSKYRGKSFREGIEEIGDGTWNGFLSLMVILFVMLIPFFGFTELRRVFGQDKLERAFFQSRESLSKP
jgi:hypothetical protein